MLEKLCEQIASTNNIGDYRIEVESCINELEKSGNMQMAQVVQQLSDIPFNRFSKQATNDAFIKSKNAVIRYLKSQGNINLDFSKEEAIRIVSVILKEFNVYIDLLFHRKPHGKCTDNVKKLFDTVYITNEYELQHFLYPVIRMVFPNARVEEYQDTGHHAVRKDIVIDDYDIAIELKCTNDTMKEADLSDEIASDMIHYNNSVIFFYIYDKSRIISNVHSFESAYRGKIEDKRIFVKVVQPVVV
ncbi:MAG: hypothetical protein IJA10_14995 [Lachnospiraceae bacterium]|nr:hypothetical protein [Lachnospiraceae bacterium]